MPPNIAIPSPPRTLEAARQFGLTDDEIWQAVDETLHAAGEDGTLLHSLDDLAAALAQRILTNARHAIAEARQAAADGL